MNGCFDDTFLIHDIPSQPTKSDKKKPRKPIYAMLLGRHLGARHNGCFDTVSQMYNSEQNREKKVRKVKVRKVGKKKKKKRGHTALHLCHVPNGCFPNTLCTIIPYL
jgi:hypothetical protein